MTATKSQTWPANTPRLSLAETAPGVFVCVFRWRTPPSRLAKQVTSLGLGRSAHSSPWLRDYSGKRCVRPGLDSLASNKRRSQCFMGNMEEEVLSGGCRTSRGEDRFPRRLDPPSPEAVMTVGVLREASGFLFAVTSLTSVLFTCGPRRLHFCGCLNDSNTRLSVVWLSWSPSTLSDLSRKRKTLVRAC